MAAANPDRSPAGRRRLLGRIVQLRRAARERDADLDPAEADPSAEDPLAALEQRVRRLETALEGLQDSVYRESVRQEDRITALERSVQPAEMARSLSRDARRRGLS